MIYEDLATGMHILHKGVQKLLQYGMSTFEIFADESHISFCDRNRIIAKCRLVAPDKQLRELPCPRDLVGSRWNCYNKMGYSEAESRDMIKRSDDYFKDQFIPGNPKELMG